MQTFKDILGRTFFMCFFIILIPIGAYTIHNGSSATVALTSYLMLSLGIPLLYLSSSKSGFGPEQKRVRRWAYIVGWLIIQGLTYQLFSFLELTFLWKWPTVGRDVAFVAVMFGQVLLSLLSGYGLSRLIGGTR